jgi:replicative DNA helicase
MTMYDIPYDATPDAASHREALHDRAAERAMLGAILLSGKNPESVAEAIKASDLYVPAHEEIFSVALELARDGRACDAVTVADRLRSIGRLEKVGGFAYLHELTANASDAYTGRYHAEIVLKFSQLRLLARTGMGLFQAGSNPATDLDDVPELYANGIRALQESASRTPGRTSPSVADMFTASLDEIEHPENVSVIHTGFPDLDEFYEGHAPGQLVIIGARPSCGKTLFALDLARHAAIVQRIPTLYITLEISRAAAMRRIIAAQAGVELRRLKDGTCTDRDWERIARLGNVFAGAPLYLEKPRGLTMGGLRQYATDMRQSADLGLIVIDYLQLMTPGKGENRQVQVAGLSRELKLLADELEIPVIVLAQLNRGSEQRTDKRPVMSDFRESGALEQDADNVLLLHREDMYHK